MNESPEINANVDNSNRDFWITVGICFLSVWVLFIFWLGWWGVAIGLIVAVPSAFVLTIVYWICVDVVRKYIFR